MPRSVTDLSPYPAIYESSRGSWDVLVGEDTALPLMEASSSGDIERLHDLLSQQHWVKIALQEQHAIYHVDESSNEENQQCVSAKRQLNLERAIIKAALNGHAAIVSALVAFAWQQGVKKENVITRYVVDRPIWRGHAGVIEALVLADPTVVNFHLHHGRLVLDAAVNRRQTEIVAVLLQHGAALKHPRARTRDGSYHISLLSKSVGDIRMTELFLKHGALVAQSGALHTAAERGQLGTMYLLIQHGADVDELLPEDTLPPPGRSLRATWTPMHFAASEGKDEAMELLKSHGASCDLLDANGKNPAQLLEDRKQGSSPTKA